MKMMRVLVAAVLCAALGGCVTNGVDGDVSDVLAKGKAYGQLASGLAAKSDNATVKKAGGWLSMFGGGGEAKAPAPYHPGGVVRAVQERDANGNVVRTITSNRIVRVVDPLPYVEEVIFDPGTVPAEVPPKIEGAPDVNAPISPEGGTPTPAAVDGRAIVEELRK